MFPIEPDDCLAMHWPDASNTPNQSTINSLYALRTGANERSFRKVQAEIGFRVTEDHWQELSHTLVDDLMVFAEVRQTGEAVAVTAAGRRPNGIAEVSWVAVSPRHRGRGLGLHICCHLTSRLIAAQERVFLSTQDHREQALQIYLTLGFQPVFRIEKVERWRVVCERLGVPFTPANWGWPR
jgi:ribosomal protein S18 acetylase RimI-like enzyme